MGLHELFLISRVFYRFSFALFPIFNSTPTLTTLVKRTYRVTDYRKQTYTHSVSKFV